MKIESMISQHRRDFTAMFVCEHCGDKVKRGGYDDANFHERVIPQIKCMACGRVAPADYVPQATKYLEEPAATIENYRDVLLAYRLADRQLCDLDLTTRDAFARLHAAEDAADDLLGLPRIERKPEREER